MLFLLERIIMRRFFPFAYASNNPTGNIRDNVWCR